MIKDMLSTGACYALVTLALVFAYHKKESVTVTDVPTISVSAKLDAFTKRADITFILGEDKKPDNRYYTKATQFYSLNPQSRTEYLVTHCRSLQEVQHYLQENQPTDGKPWGLINLVSHGNQWMGLSARIKPEGKRATTKSILEAVQSGELAPLPSCKIDASTTIFLHGCGLGNNEAIIGAIANAFGQEGHQPTVRASRLFEYYSSITSGKAVVAPQRYLAKPYILSYKMGYQPNEPQLISQLEKQYPQATVNWGEAVNRTSPRWPGDSYHITFEVPLKWVIPVDSMPDISTKSKQNSWIATRQEITDQLQKLELSSDKFNWWFRKVYVKNEEGQKQPAVWLKGYCTVLTVLEAMTTDDIANPHSPYHPSLEDQRFYASNRLTEGLQLVNGWTGCEEI